MGFFSDIIMLCAINGKRKKMSTRKLVYRNRVFLYLANTIFITDTLYTIDE